MTLVEAVVHRVAGTICAGMPVRSTRASSAWWSLFTAALLTEVRRTGHEDRHLHDPDPAQATHRPHSGGEAVERGMARELLRDVQLHVPADNVLTQQLAVFEEELAGEVEGGAHPSGGA
ncbi:hypothetical protein [Streptomyces sp. NPDC020597]|uniref:hypothetical protein n=1 Tax=unclassified Streptomyces TaxID=2593676 RepID=UPI0037B9A1B4